MRWKNRMQVRKPAVSGIFYPSDREALLASIRDCFLHDLGPKSFSLDESKRFIAMITPHAAYIYSGAIAAHSYLYASSLKPDLVILLGPNHYGLGSGVVSMRDALWETPLGDVAVDNDAVDKASKLGMIDIDFYAHRKEHSLEVQLPMLQFIYHHEFKILPIILWMQDIDTAKEVGRVIAEIAKDRNALLIASADFTHDEPNEVAHKKDKELISAIQDLDLLRFYTVLERLNVTACGYGAIASIIHASRLLGAERGELLKYATSGDVAGNKDSVVGYASMIIS